MSNCPVPYTCPLIDDVIKRIESLDPGKPFEDMTIFELKSLYDDLLEEVSQIPNKMEEIREANSSIRDWGDGQYDKAVELENSLEYSESRNVELTREVTSLESHIEDLNETLRNWSEMS